MADDFDYEYNLGGGRDSADALKSWIPTIIMMFCFFPVGICMLIYKLFGFAGYRKTTTRHPYDIEHGRAGQGAGEQYRRKADTAAGDARREAKAAADEIRREARAAADEIRREAKNVAREAKSAAESVTREARAAGKAAGYQATERAAGYQAAGRKASKKAAKKAAARKENEAGQGLVVGGTITAAVAGFVAFAGFIDIVGYGGLAALFGGIGMEEVFFPLGICGAGLVMLYYGVQKRKKTRRYRKYLALIGRRESISVISLAQAMGVSVHRACDDLQDMLDEGVIPVGFLDMGSGRLILNGEGLRDEPTPEPEPARAAEPEAPRGMEREDQALLEIRNLNDAIADEEMSRKIDRIGEITGKIFAYLRDKPDKEGQLRSFLSYYLPTTLKILRAYAQMEAQGIEGDNITAAKERIEGMMDKVVDGFEKQLDKLFQDDAMDITTDVAVLERMLDKDGLGGGQGMTLGGL